MNTLPRVEYASSITQSIADDWVAFVNTQLFPSTAVCDGCNGVIHLESHNHIYGKVVNTVDVADVSIPEGDLNKVASAMAIAICKDGKPWEAERTVRSVLTRLKKEAATGHDIVTWCQHCKKWVVLEQPGHIRGDQWESLAKRVTESRPIVDNPGEPASVPKEVANPLLNPLIAIAYFVAGAVGDIIFTALF